MVDEGDANGSRLARADVLPLEVVPAGAPAAEQLLRWNSDNLDLLHAVAAFEDLPREGRDDHSALSVEIGKLDAKLRLILRLLGRQMAAGLPAQHDLRLGSTRLEWAGPAPGPAGSHVVAHVYLSPVILEPLHLPGRLSGDTAGPAGRTWQGLNFEGLSHLVVAALEKHIFLHHRRAIAQSRPSHGP